MAVLSQGFDEASVARIPLSSCTFGIYAVNGDIGTRSKLLRRAAKSCCSPSAVNKPTLYFDLIAHKYNRQITGWEAVTAVFLS